MPNKTILHIITGLGVGGAERALCSVLSHGLIREYESHVVSLTGPGYYGDHLKTLGVTVHDLHMKAGRPSIAGLFKLAALSRRLRPDLIHGWMYHANLAAVLARVLAPGRPPLVWGIRHSLDDPSVDGMSTRIARAIGAVLSSSPEAIIYNSSTARAQHQKAGYSKNGMVIHNGFETQLWRPDVSASAEIRRSLGISLSDVVVGFVGRFHPAKDLSNFYVALAPLMARRRDLHCVVLGRNTDASNIELAPAIARLPSSRTHFLGQRTDVNRFMTSFDFFCLSSRSEAFPNVIGEAMACGVPCVTTDVGDADCHCRRDWICCSGRR